MGREIAQPGRRGHAQPLRETSGVPLGSRFGRSDGSRRGTARRLGDPAGSRVVGPGTRLLGRRSLGRVFFLGLREGPIDGVVHLFLQLRVGKRPRLQLLAGCHCDDAAYRRQVQQEASPSKRVHLGLVALDCILFPRQGRDDRTRRWAFERVILVLLFCAATLVE